jgi:hypothetical protein
MYKLKIKKGASYQKIKKIVDSTEKKISLFLIIFTILFLGAFMAIVYSYNGFFRKYKGPQPIKTQFEIELANMVKGYPIESMVSEIAQQDKKVAAFMISIAKKESNWGKRVPVLDGRDCYNYWGYRGQGNEMGSGGHTCFKSREEAVSTIAKRIKELVYEDELDSPQKLVVWKCGNACGSDNPIGVKKWIRDVKYYYNKIID